MKGVVFSFKKADFTKKKVHFNFSFADVHYFFKRYGITVVFVLLLFTGLVFGSVYAQFAGKSLLNSLDFLFTTNFDVRLSQNAVGTFCACFASDFIFLFTVFLLGMAPWGIPVMPVILFFRGFGTGLTAGYLFLTHSLEGVGFYLLILLPGTFLFCMALIIFTTSAFKFSKKMFSNTISKTVPRHPLWSSVVSFCSQSMTALIMTFFSAVLDTALWTLFAGVFNF